MSCRMSNIRPGGKFEIDYNPRYLPDDFEDKYRQYVLNDGDVVIAMTDLAGSPKILGVPTVVETKGRVILLNQRVGKLIIKDAQKVHFGYLKFALSEPRIKKYYQKFAGGGLQINLGKEDLLSVEIPLPPLAVQKQIAAVLEKADTLRSQCQLMEQELNTLAQSVFLDMFGDLRKADKADFLPLGNCADVCSGVTKGQKFGDKPTVVAPYMRVANVQDGYLDLSEIKEIEAKVTDFKKYLLQVGDILMTEGGDHDKLGRGAVWEGQIENCIHQNHVFRVRLHDNYLPKFFEYLLQSQYAKQYFLKCAKKTTNLASINITQLKSLPMPPVELIDQQSFVDFVDRLDAQKRNLQKAKQQMADNFSSLMQRAFKGELELKGVA